MPGGCKNSIITIHESVIIRLPVLTLRVLSRKKLIQFSLTSFSFVSLCVSSLSDFHFRFCFNAIGGMMISHCGFSRKIIPLLWIKMEKSFFIRITFGHQIRGVFWHKAVLAIKTQQLKHKLVTFNTQIFLSYSRKKYPRGERLSEEKYIKQYD